MDALPEKGQKDAGVAFANTTARKSNVTGIGSDIATVK
jgi:hypothetical protein